MCSCLGCGDMWLGECGMVLWGMCAASICRLEGSLQAASSSIRCCQCPPDLWTYVTDCHVDFTAVMSPIFSLISSVGFRESKHMHVCVHAHICTHAHRRCCWTSGAIVALLNITQFLAKFHCSLHIERQKMWTGSGAFVPFCYSAVCHS